MRNISLLKYSCFKNIFFIGLLIYVFSFFNMKLYGKADTSNVQKERIDSYLIKDIGIEGNLFITLNDCDGNKNNVEEIYFESTGFMNFIGRHPEFSKEDITVGIKDGLMSSPVKGIYNYTFRIIGDDGKEYGTLTGTQLMTENDLAFTKPEILDYVKEFLSSKKNNTKIEIKNVTGTLLPHETIGLCSIRDEAYFSNEHRSFLNPTREFDSSWTGKSASAKIQPSKWGQLIGTKELTTQNGNYCFYYYSADSNDQDIENIILYRDNEPFYCRVDGITESAMTHITHDGFKDDEFSIGVINLSDPDKGKHLIFDNELFNFIINIAGDSNLGKSLFLKKNLIRFSLTPYGDIKLMESVNQKLIKEPK